MPTPTPKPTPTPTPTPHHPTTPTTPTTPRFDLPEIDAFTRPYWDAAAEGRLLIRRCGECGTAHHYPRELCPHCWSENVTWEQASGRATLYTWSVVHRNDLPPFNARTPYTAAVVDLIEGPRMMTELIDCTGSDLRIGAPLEATFRRATDTTPAIAVFRPGQATHGIEGAVFRPGQAAPGTKG